MKNSLLLVICAIILWSCDTDDNTSTDNLEIALISQNNLYGAGSEGITQQNLIISETTVWNDLLIQLDTENDVTTEFSETEIDFSEYMVIAVFDEVKPNGGHLIDLNISIDNQTVVVEIINLVPDGGATTVITQPFHIVKISKTDMPIIFQ